MPKLPPRLFAAQTVRVVEPNRLLAEIELNFGVKIRRTLQLEGIPDTFAVRSWRAKAIHALVVLAGGKKLVVHVDDAESEPLIGRVYLDERVHGRPAGLECPYGLDVEMLDLSTYLLWLKDQQFDIGLVKRTLNGAK